MALVEKADRNLTNQLDDLEQKIFLLKIEYEKYFSGVEKVEPFRDRQAIQRLLRDFNETPMRVAQQRFRYQTLKARFQALELYWNRNLTMVERGTHPKMRFRADLKAKAPATEPRITAEQEAVLRERQERQEREERAYKLVYEKYVEARRQCGQSTDLAFDAVRDALKNQVRQIKSTYKVESVKFRVVIEGGKAKVKAVPQQPTPDAG